MKRRCGWAEKDELLRRYHDEEWGVPNRDDALLFECLVLQCMQAGLSWRTILAKRENFRVSFDHFRVECIAGYGEEKIRELLRDPGIVRNRMKIDAVVSNARAFLQVRREHGSFHEYIWRFVRGSPIDNRWRSLREIPAKSRESTQLSEDLKKRGFRFVGPTICYAFMQAAGLVNDHLVDCFRHEEVGRIQAPSSLKKPHFACPDTE